MLKLNYLLLFIFLSSTFVQAESGGVGNGGDVMVCSDGTYTLLDSYEAKKQGLTIDLNNPRVSNPTHRSMVMVAVARLAEKDKYTAKKLYEFSMELVTDLEQFAAFPNETGIYRGKNLYLGPDVVGEISDSRHRTLPPGCHLRQLVSQLLNPRSLENRFEMNKTFWDKLDLTDQAMTILHEAWYRIMLEDGAQDSIGARYMNGIVASQKFASMNFADYLSDLKATEKKFYIVENNSTLIFDKKFQVDLKQLQLNFDGSRVCTKQLHVAANIKEVAFITNIHFGLRKTRFENVCFRNSVLESLTLPNDLGNGRVNFVMQNYLVRTDGFKGGKGVLEFNTNGTLKQVKNMHIEALYKMFYACKINGRKVQTFTKQPGCKGPYLHYPSQVKAPGPVAFDLREVPIGFSFPDKV